MKICVYARSSYSRIGPAIVSRICRQHPEVEATYVVQNIFEAELVRRVDAENRVLIVSDYIKEHWGNLGVEELQKYEGLFECSPVWKYIYTDRFLVHHSKEYIEKIVCGYFGFYDDLFHAKDYNCYFDETIALASSYIAYFVAKHYGITYLAPMAARGFDGTHHYYTSDPYQMCEGIENPHSPQMSIDESRVVAESFLDEFEGRDIKPHNMIYTGMKPRITKRFFFTPAIYLRRKLNWKLEENKYDYIDYHQAEHAFDPVLFYCRYQKYKKLYSQPDYSRKYVYYPLHYQPEASTLVCAQKFEKQIMYIDWLAKSLPADTVLYVKEHYALLGHRESMFYKQVKRYPNVVLIDPWVNSRDLILGSQAITTMTGTAGWEAMLLRKPVLLAGKIFFSEAPGVLNSEDIFGNYTRLLGMWRQPSREDIILYLSKFVRALYPGSVSPANPKTFADENLDLLAKSFWSELSYMQEL